MQHPWTKGRNHEVVPPLYVRDKNESLTVKQGYTNRPKTGSPICEVTALQLGSYCKLAVLGVKPGTGCFHAGVPVDVFWFICGKNTVSIRSHLHLFGALKRMQQWHNANITVLCSNEFDRQEFLCQVLAERPEVVCHTAQQIEIATKLFNPSVVWQGSLVFWPITKNWNYQDSNCVVKGGNSSQLHRKRNKKRSTDVENRLCIAPEITVLCKVQKRTVPFHMFLSVRLGLSLDYSSPKLSTRLVEWLSLEVNEDIALIGSLQLVTPSKHGCMKGKNKEAWFNFVKSQNHSVGGPLRFPDLTDMSLFETEQNLTDVLLGKLQLELKDSDDLSSANPPPDIVDQMISAKWKFLREKRKRPWLNRERNSCFEMVRNINSRLLTKMFYFKTHQSKRCTCGRHGPKHFSVIKHQEESLGDRYIQISRTRSDDEAKGKMLPRSTCDIVPRD
ncbi:hypothetical protein OS493_039553 [Desmophyllum pertusum]|uniref:DM2 domain-containing protein n=1 Tax=Desmophyllum pertusum TaxID=174260 RepID=A0A9W9ZUW5_9CNID|nr:hypothetical protein OS493_039553 [Desmophyllum pertusum]